jgi:hypothetical protein
MKRSIWILCVVPFACTNEPKFPVAHFAAAPPVTIVNDRRDVPKPPKERVAMQDRYALEVLVTRPVERTLDVPRPQRAKGVNSMDEVPDSTWFTNRPPLTAEQVRTGPLTVDTPENHFPWTVTSNKFGGASDGFMVKDARGMKWLIKLDDIRFPEAATGADAVSDRLMWAAGYNTAEDEVVYFRFEDLVLAPDAHIKGRHGDNQGKLTIKKVREMLLHTELGKDHRYRATASRWLDGKPAGDPGGQATRKDDPNDRIPHELRRDRRGLKTFYSWIDIVDVWPGNFLDMWIADHGRHYLLHYLIDFDSSLAQLGSQEYDMRRSYTYRWDWPTMWGSLMSAGLISWDWEGRPRKTIRGVPALFTSVGFDPGRWHCDLPYLPFQTADRVDAFWAAKILSRFTREQIHAAAEAGRYSDPRATEYIADTLVERQHKIVAYWYKQVNPLDGFDMSDQLCFEDLAISQGYADRDTTRYELRSRDARGRVLTPANVITAMPNGQTCTRVPALADAPDSYTIVEVTTVRPDFRGTTYVHVARDTTGALHVVGVWRM